MVTFDRPVPSRLMVSSVVDPPVEPVEHRVSNSSFEPSRDQMGARLEHPVAGTVILGIPERSRIYR